MKKLFAAAAVAASMVLAPAHATLIDFANEADTNGERGLPQSSSITIDGVNLQINSGNPNVGPNGSAAWHPYLDAGNAGLGVCKVLATINNVPNQCDPGSDDNITSDEGVFVGFIDGPRTITDLVFRDFQHNLLGLGNDGFVTIWAFSGGGNTILTELFSTFISMAQGGDAFFADLTGIRFDFAGTEFYVSAMDVSDIPIPAALPLLLSGLAGLGFASRKKKKATA